MWSVLSLVSLVAVWWIVALVIGSRTLPAPDMVYSAFAGGLASGELIYHVAVTLARVAASFTLAMVIGCAIGVARKLLGQA